jgi:hypothetical protein
VRGDLKPTFRDYLSHIQGSSFFDSLRGVRWFETDVLGLPIGSIFKGEASWTALVLEEGT